MRLEDWVARWKEGRTPFHLEEINPWLVRFADRLLGEATASATQGKRQRVLVPMCGKSNDLAWLQARGCDVIGVEVAERALRQFFAEHDLVADVRRHVPFTVLRAPGIETWAGDFFAFTPEMAGRIDAVYDRAALIALPDPERRRYAEHLARLVTPGGRLLLVGLEYEQGAIEGPPFSLSPVEVSDLFATLGDAELLGRADARLGLPGLADLAAAGAEEFALLIEKRRAAP